MNSTMIIRLTGFTIAGLAVASMGFASTAIPSTASASPNCANSSVGNPTQCCVKVGDAPGPGPSCTSNDPPDRGLLGGVPIARNLGILGGGGLL